MKVVKVFYPLSSGWSRKAAETQRRLIQQPRDRSYGSISLYQSPYRGFMLQRAESAMKNAKWVVIRLGSSTRRASTYESSGKRTVVQDGIWSNDTRHRSEETINFINRECSHTFTTVEISISTFRGITGQR